MCNVEIHFLTLTLTFHHYFLIIKSTQKCQKVIITNYAVFVGWTAFLKNPICFKTGSKSTKVCTSAMVKQLCRFLCSSSQIAVFRSMTLITRWLNMQPPPWYRIHNAAVVQPWSDNEEYSVMLEWAGGSIHHHNELDWSEQPQKDALAPKNKPSVDGRQQKHWREAALRLSCAWGSELSYFKTAA